MPEYPLVYYRDRDSKLIASFKTGYFTTYGIACEFGLSVSRVNQILRLSGVRKKRPPRKVAADQILLDLGLTRDRVRELMEGV